MYVYSNQPEEFGFNFFAGVISLVDRERVAFWNSHHSLGRQMTEHFMKYINWDIDGNACERK